MTIDNVIESVKAIKQGYDFEEEEIIRGINDVEMMIINEIVRGREGEDEINSSYGNYTAETDREQELIAGAPYGGMYREYVCALIEMRNQNIELYQMHMICFNNLIEEFKRAFIRTHRQKRNYPYHF